MSASNFRLTPSLNDLETNMGVINVVDGQANFADAILDPNAPLPVGLVGPDGKPSAKRFAVYRNNVVVGLIETLKAAYPVIHRLVGEEFFAAMAHIYVRNEPPHTPIMLDYGASFPHFIERFEPAAPLPYLPDVARFERGWVEAYHAPEALPLPPSALGAISSEDVPTLRLVLHPSVRVVRSPFPVVRIWQANVDGQPAVPIDLGDGEEDALIVRPEMDVEVRRLPVGAAAFIRKLQDGLTIVDAAAEGLSENAQFDLGDTLSGMIEARIIVDYVLSSIRSVEAA